ncbi:MAG: DUF29 domain-containing protein [Janthinobacterium lividum]
MDDASIDTLVEEQRGQTQSRYDDDIHAWAMEQAEHLKAGRFAALDLINLADEVADVGHSQYDKLESDLARVIQHLLKWDHQPGQRSRSWANTVKEHRRRVERQLRRNPSLKALRIEALQEAFDRGRADALSETDLPDDVFPSRNPYLWDDAMTRPIVWPEP